MDEKRKRRRAALAVLLVLSLVTGCATMGRALPEGPASCAAMTAARDSARTVAAYMDASLSARTDAACGRVVPPVEPAPPVAPPAEPAPPGAGGGT